MALNQQLLANLANIASGLGGKRRKKVPGATPDFNPMASGSGMEDVNELLAGLGLGDQERRQRAKADAAFEKEQGQRRNKGNTYQEQLLSGYSADVAAGGKATGDIIKILATMGFGALAGAGSGAAAGGAASTGATAGTAGGAGLGGAAGAGALSGKAALLEGGAAGAGALSGKAALLEGTGGAASASAIPAAASGGGGLFSQLGTMFKNELTGGGGFSNDPLNKLFQQEFMGGDAKGDIGGTLMNMGRRFIQNGDIESGFQYFQTGLKMSQDTRSKEQEIEASKKSTQMADVGTKIGDIVQKNIGTDKAQDFMVTGYNPDETPILKPHSSVYNRSARQTVENVTPGDPRTDQAKSKEFTDFQAQVRTTSQAIRSLRRATGALKQSDAPFMGMAGDFVRTADNIVSTMGQYLKEFGDKGVSRAEAMETYSSQFAGKIRNTHVQESLLSELTFNLAAALNKGDRITEKDVKAAARIIGQSVVNHKSAEAVFKDVERRLRDAVDDSYIYAGSEDSKAELEHLYETFLGEDYGEDDKPKDAPIADPASQQQPGESRYDYLKRKARKPQ